MSKVILFTHPIYEHITDERRKYKWCADKEEFMKKIKSYGDESSIVMPWNDTEHDRKFIECKCDVLNKNYDIVLKNNQRFWGEWEQPSWVFNIAEDDKLKEKESLVANYVHIPLFGKLDENMEINERYKYLQNTDPYVFGDSFYYCCCKQSAKNTRRNLIDLNENDVIIFCGLAKDEGKEYKYVIDTIFVIENKVCKYGTSKTNIRNKDILENLDVKYINGVLNPVLHGNNESLGRDETNYLMLYQAKMYKDDKEIFSYFPVKDETNYKRVEIPYDVMSKILHIEQTGKKIRNKSQASLHEIDSIEVWKSLKKYIVEEKGYLMGIKAYDDFDEYIIESK